MSEEMKSETDNIQEQSNEDFNVIFVSKTDDGTVVATTPLSIRDQKLQLALSQYDPENKKYSVYLNEGISPSKSISVEEIEELSTNTQNDLNKVLRNTNTNLKIYILNFTQKEQQKLLKKDKKQQ